MLYPQRNPFRSLIDLSGFWELRFDPEDVGKAQGWTDGVDGTRPIAVPASWNDQFADHRDYLDAAWYQTTFDRPRGWDGRRVMLRFNSVNYLAEVWLNGERVGAHEGGHLPFAFDVTPHLQAEGNRLVVRVEGRLAPDRVPPGNVPADPQDAFANLNYPAEGRLAPDRVPPGNVPADPQDAFANLNYPAASFDFFPFCGIHRPVLLYTVPTHGLDDLTVTTEIDGTTGVVDVRMRLAGSGEDVEARVALQGHGADAEAAARFDGAGAETTLTVPDAALWSPGAPHLYDLTVTLARGGEPFDRYTLPVGVRTIAVEGDRLLLNGEPITLTGFGRHEDFPITGRGLVPAVVVKDYALMDWIGANSFRTSHYPYSEPMMRLADRLGFLIIDETPAVGLFFKEEGLDRRLALCRQYVEELIDRDKNHPSVIMWSLANEPHSTRPEAEPFFRELYDLAKRRDPTRPVTLVSHVGLEEAAFAFVDVLCLNRYFGWYTQSGRIDAGLALLEQELDALYARYQKPLILSEFGADTIPGHHALPPEMFSEEYQADFLTGYINLLNRKPYVVGQHVWNLCDFKTAQAVHRMGAMNYKGVFTRDRRPKLAAHRLRELWRDTALAKA